MLRRFPLLLVLFLAVLAGGCHDHTAVYTNRQVVVFSDLHFSPFYDQTLYPELVSNEAAQWPNIFKSSSVTAPAAWGNDANYPLLVQALAGVRQNLGTSQLVIFTGDLLGHGIPQLFYARYFADLGLPGTTTPDATAVAAMKAFTDKTLAFVIGQIRESVGSLPVMFAVGNGDSYSGYGPNILNSGMPPDNSFLVNNAALFYTGLLNGSGDRQAFEATFTNGGYYAVEPAGSNLMVISLNTIACTTLFYPVQSSNSSAVTAELDWFETRLALAAATGRHVILLMHAPPGVDIGSTLNGINPASTPVSGATMMWWPDYQTRFLQILSSYPGRVSWTLAGHSHTDEFRLLTASDSLEITPSIAPYFGNNPAFKVYTLSGDSYRPLDYRSVNYDLATSPAQFNDYYTFSMAYPMWGWLDRSLALLYPTLAANSLQQALYRSFFYSGHNMAASAGDTHINPVNNANWRFYRCGIGNMEQQQFVECVNSY